MLQHKRPLGLAALTAALSAGLFAGSALAQTTADEPVAIAEVAATPGIGAEAVSLAETDSLPLAAFPVALLAVAAGTVVAANRRA